MTTSSVKKMNLCKAHVHIKYITTGGLVFADVIESGTLYSDVRISRITMNKLFNNECVYGKLVPLIPKPAFAGALFVSHYTFLSINPKK